MPLFFVRFSRIGNGYRGLQRSMEVKDVLALEKPIQKLVDQILPDQNVEVTIEPERMVGQLDYGLRGNFTIEAM